MFGSESLEILKAGDSNRTQNWVWFMVTFSPKFFSFTKPQEPAYGLQEILIKP